MRKFIVKIFSFSIVPFILILVPTLLYMKRDVYADFKQYNNYSWKYSFQQLGDLSTKKLLKAPNNKYNSFIFGSSRTTGVYACYLQHKIPNAHFFHYANWNESIGGMDEKLKLLDTLGYNISNVVIYLDTDNTFENDGVCHPSDHYLLTQKSERDYMLSHYKSFFSSLNADKIKILCGMPVSGGIYPNWESDPVTNDCKHFCTDSIIAAYGDVLHDEKFIHKMDSLKANGFLYKRSATQQYRPQQISAGEERMLLNIKRIFDKHNTSYYIVIAPLYDQEKFAPADMAILRRCFGSRLYDFSGINAITNNVYNYPDRKHFQPYISKMILDSVITDKSSVHVQMTKR